MRWESPFLKWTVWFILFIAFFISAIFMMGNAAERLNEFCNNTLVPDLTLLLTKSHLTQFFELCQSQGINYYREVLVIQDIIYPFTYSSFFAISFINFFNAQKRNDFKVLNRMLVFPLITLLSDIFENMMFLKLSYEFPNMNSLTFYAATFFHTLKWVAAFISIGIFLYLIIKWLRFVLIQKRIQNNNY